MTERNEKREQHEELSPLHRVRVKMQHRLESNLVHADRHPDHHVRAECAVRVQVYRLVLSELDTAIAQAGTEWVDRIVEARVKEKAVATEAAVAAMKAVTT